MQQFCRARLATEEVSAQRTDSLSPTLVRRAIALINSPNLRLTPVAHSGHTTVYLPKETKVAIKAYGATSQLRLAEARAARCLCHKHGFDCLVVPRVLQYGLFVIATQLPNPPDYKHSIGIYLENSEAFDVAVGQFTRFLYYAHLPDIAGVPTHPYSTRCTVPLGRYDNLLLFLEAGVGRIGLVDVDDFQPSVGSPELYLQRCLDVVRLFPCHLPTILRNATALVPDIALHRERLTQEAAAAVLALHAIYTRHAAFMIDHGIKPADPLALLPISPAQMEALEGHVTAAVTTALADPQSILHQRGVTPNVVLTGLHASFPTVVQTILSFLAARLQQQLSRKAPPLPLSSLADATAHRTVYWESAFSTTANSSNSPYQQCHAPLSHLLDLSKTIPKNFLHKQVTQLVIQAVFSSLVAADFIADYTPCVGGPGEYHLKECCSV